MLDRNDTSELSLPMEKALERQVVHRDYIAHCLRYSYFLKLVKRGINILDIGAGRGNILKGLYSNKLKPNLYVAIDVKRRKIKKLLEFKTNFKVVGIVTDIRTDKLKSLTNTFDLVACFEVIEHFEVKYLPHVLNEIKRVLKPGGRLILSTPNYDGVHHAKNHVHEYREEELEWYLDQAFTIERRHGTFASQKNIVSVLTAYEKSVWILLKEWFNSDVLSIIFASLHPSQSRNILWVCKKDESSS